MHSVRNEFGSVLFGSVQKNAVLLEYYSYLLLYYYLILVTLFRSRLKRSLCAHLMRVKLILFTFYLNGGLDVVSIGKPSERMSNFWTVRFLKTEYEPNFDFLHIPKINVNVCTQRNTY